MPWKRGQTIIAILCVLLLTVATACGSGDDDDNDTAAATSTGATSTATTPSISSAAESTPTVADETEATATEEETEATAPATATEEEEEEPTATTQTQATATDEDEYDSVATATTTTGGGSTATEPSEATTPATGDLGGDIPEFETLDPELLPNFSMRMNFDATNLSGTPQTTLMMQMEQSGIDNYHLDMESDGELLEFWTIGEQSWTSIGGEVIESPTGPLFSPADILTTGELIPEGLEARNEGTEEVNGRETTKWVVDGADYVAFMNEDASSTVEMTGGSGEVTIWIDNELNIMIKAEGDVAWMNDDDTDGSLIYDYEIYDIDSTAQVQAPQ
ncbi:MAG: hypothetical protein M3439_03725 [Chloroflexota bacterium]|nr:hypothetical protein [Chloroflexota bacterium]